MKGKNDLNQKVDLLEGPITPTLVRLALPIMGASFIQTAYNLVDMVWIGRLGSGAVAAVGAAGLFLWFANGITLIPKTGGQIRTGQSLGAGEEEAAAAYAAGALQMGAVLGILYGVACLIFNRQLIGFFRLNSPEVVMGSRNYLMITCGLSVFSFIGQVFGGIFTAAGDTVTTFRVTTVGLLINLLLDPLFIFGIGPIKGMGIIGAAVATVLAQIIVFVLYLRAAGKEPGIFRSLHIFSKPQKDILSEITKIGLPAAIQDCMFCSISMVIARIIAGWGDGAVAAQKVGNQIESISWMIAGGFSSAVNSFTAQNYGAKQKERLKQGYKVSVGCMALWGLLASVLLLAFPQLLFRIFIDEQDILPIGVTYLRIIGLSEIFICLEAVAAAAFQGMGRTVPPSAVSISLNVVRIPAALILSSSLGLNGIWWALSLSCILKGTVLQVWFAAALKKYSSPHGHLPA